MDNGYLVSLYRLFFIRSMHCFAKVRRLIVRRIVYFKGFPQAQVHTVYSTSAMEKLDIYLHKSVTTYKVEQTG